MSTLLKDIYSPNFYNRLAASLEKVLPSFDKQKFISLVLTENFELKELKERMRHTTQALHAFMPANFAEAAELLPTTITQLKADGFGEGRLEFLFLPDYIETYGLNHYENSIKLLEHVTQYITCEFAIRPFLRHYYEPTLAQMLVWSGHEKYQVRRLASEGSRPRLPWAMAVPALKKDPTPIFPILENLKADPSEIVRRSVANNLNDIAKDHPNLVVQTATQWKGASKETDALIKHGCRTLLKQGHPEILTHYGLSAKNVILSGFEVNTPVVPIGGNLEFVFKVKNEQSANQIIRVEYAVYYLKQNNTYAKKVFKISERLFLPLEEVTITRQQSFKRITTRTFYPGGHRLGLILNGEEKAVKSFDLVSK
ncbi:DNA alkylation repair protein [Adhaeribacter radiodurans]|uniref:DNA alkylation repair protein n=1 Tax=Adhaeribacter radiodurans TaxID=2745197 RepID=A0A7L7LDK3_9BACT|nr:DNA alkylation repair protein [Adhaeribacter radiodurans]QMU30900.1 DNA alkylation repair protein [Adhaeribacter radiodurans]